MSSDQSRYKILWFSYESNQSLDQTERRKHQIGYIPYWETRQTPMQFTIFVCPLLPSQPALFIRWIIEKHRVSLSLSLQHQKGSSHLLLVSLKKVVQYFCHRSMWNRKGVQPYIRPKSIWICERYELPGVILKWNYWLARKNRNHRKNPGLKKYIPTNASTIYHSF